jgi:hypothetical protein
MLSETVVYILSFIIYVGIGAILIHIGDLWMDSFDWYCVLFVALAVAIRIAYMTEWPKAFLACVTYIVGIWIIGFFLGSLGG